MEWVRVGLLIIVAATAVGPLGCATTAGRAGSPVVPSLAEAPEALAALQASRFDQAEQQAKDLLAQEDRNAQAHLVAAITRYKRAMHQLTTDVVAIGAGAFVRGLNRQYLTFALTNADVELAAVEAHLAAAGRDPGIALELCLACWRVDWNRTGDVDRRDERLFEIEIDSEGEPIPEGDPRRRPTFRFDTGDVFWARAMVAFQRTLLQLGLAYEWPEPRALLEADRGRGDAAGRAVIIKLKDVARVHRARELILDGLAYADRCRTLYLAETDDDGEWVPNPRQRNHPLPLPVDEALYQTWEGVLGDVRKLVAGEEGIDIAQAAQLGDHQWADPPRGFLNVGRLLEAPADVVLDFTNLERLDGQRARADVEAVLSDVFGDKYQPRMKPSGLLKRITRMRAEVERGEESFERKLRYLFWLN